MSAWRHAGEQVLRHFMSACVYWDPAVGRRRFLSHRLWIEMVSRHFARAFGSHTHAKLVRYEECVCNYLYRSNFLAV